MYIRLSFLGREEPHSSGQGSGLVQDLSSNMLSTRQFIVFFHSNNVGRGAVDKKKPRKSLDYLLTFRACKIHVFFTHVLVQHAQTRCFSLFFWGGDQRCLEDEMNGKHERMKLVSRQSHILSSVTELAVSLRRPPQDVVPALFARLAVSDVGIPHQQHHQSHLLLRIGYDMYDM